MNKDHQRIYIGDDIAFVNIPKNASQTMDMILLESLKWTVSNKMEQTMLCFGLIRHPIDRWIGGITQFYGSMGGKMLERLTNKNGIEWFVDKGIHDCHTEPQNWHWKAIPKKQRRLYKMENIKTLQFDMGIGINWPHKHNHLDHPVMAATFLRVETLLDQAPRLVAKLKEKYQDDLILYAGAA
jgi:hypothetical protein